LFAVCGMNVRKQIKKKYGPNDLVTVGTQTDENDFVIRDCEECRKRMEVT
jgi:hypothetical protein